MRHRQDPDFTRCHPRAQRRKAVDVFGDGSPALGREVGSRSVPHFAGSTHLPDRRFAEWRRREQIARRERSAVEAWPRRAGRFPYHSKRTAVTERIVEFQETVAISLWEAFTFHRRP